MTSTKAYHNAKRLVCGRPSQRKYYRWMMWERIYRELLFWKGPGANKAKAMNRVWAIKAQEFIKKK